MSLCGMGGAFLCASGGSLRCQGQSTASLRTPLPANRPSSFDHYVILTNNTWIRNGRKSKTKEKFLAFFLLSDPRKLHRRARFQQYQVRWLKYFPCRSRNQQTRKIQGIGIKMPSNSFKMPLKTAEVSDGEVFIYPNLEVKWTSFTIHN